MIFRHKKIHFSLLLVSNIEKFKLAQSKIRPTFSGF